MIVYIDESGDLGWKFDLPNRKGGSSRFITIAYIIIPKEKAYLLPRFVRKIYKKYKLKEGIEKKGTSFTDKEASYISKRIIDLINNNEDIKIGCITVNKNRVEPHIRQDGNILYNYSLVLALSEQIKNFQNAHIVPDKRTIKVKHGDSLYDYLKIKLSIELRSPIVLTYNPTESHSEPSLWVIDWIANFIWRHYEDKRSDAYTDLSHKLREIKLFF